MKTYVTHITPRNGIPHRFELEAETLDAAKRAAQLFGMSLFGLQFTFSVRQA